MTNKVRVHFLNGIDPTELASCGKSRRRCKHGLVAFSDLTLRLTHVHKRYFNANFI